MSGRGSERSGAHKGKLSSRWQLLLQLGFAACLSACASWGGRAEQEQLPAEAAASQREAAAWLYFPGQAAPLVAELKWGEDERLVLDERGTRWLVLSASSREEGAPVRGVPALSGAGEALSAVWREGKEFVFLAQSGAVYRSAEPLGDWEKVILPPQPFIQALRWGEELLALSAGGELFRSRTGGRSWEREEVPAFFSQLYPQPGGELLALGTPEQWWMKARGEQKWRSLSLPSVGPSGRAFLSEGGASVVGMQGNWAWQADGWRQLDSSAEVQEALHVPYFATAEALTQGDAGWLDGRFYRLMQKVNEQGELRWSLLVGEWTEPLWVGRPLPDLMHCWSMRLAVTHRHLTVSCQMRTEKESSPPWEIWRSEDEGRSWRRLPLHFRASPEELLFVSHASGTLAWGRICPPEASEAGCAGRGAYFYDEREARLAPVPSATRLVASQMLFLDAQTLALGGQGVQRSSLRPQQLVLRAPLRPDAKRRVQVMDVAQQLRLPPGRTVRKMDLIRGAGEELFVSVYLQAGIRILQLDKNGDLQSEGWAPEGAQAVSGGGGALVGLDPQRARVWESQTGGLSWSESALPRDLCEPSQKECKSSLVCEEAGCLLGERWARVGWGKSEPLLSAEPLHSVEKTSPRSRRKDSFICERVGEEEDLSALSALPGLADAAWGESAWIQAESRAELGQAWVVAAPRKQSQLKREELFPPLQIPRSQQLVLVEQLEGTVAFRFPTPQKKSDTLHISGVDIAWSNQATGARGQAVWKDEIELRVPTHLSWQGLAPDFPAFASISGEGVYVRWTASEPKREPLYFFTGDQVELLPARSGGLQPGAQPGGVTRVGRENVVFSWHPAAQKIVLQTSAAGLQSTPFSLAPPYVQEHQLQTQQALTYQGSTLGIFTAWWGEKGPHRAYFIPWSVPLRGEEARAVPLLADLPEQPVFCDAKQRDHTPRVLAPEMPGESARFSWLNESGERESWELSRALLQGTPEAPCVAAWEGTRQSSGVSQRVLVLGEGELSWLFTEQPLAQQGSAASRALRRSGQALRCRSESL